MTGYVWMSGSAHTRACQATLGGFDTGPGLEEIPAPAAESARSIHLHAIRRIAYRRRSRLPSERMRREHRSVGLNEAESEDESLKSGDKEIVLATRHPPMERFSTTTSLPCTEPKEKTPLRLTW